MNIKIQPKCHPNFNKDTQTYEEPNMVPAYVGRGFLLPCCLCDNHSDDDFEQLGFFKEHLRVSNITDLNEIFKSKQWVNFHKTLIEVPNKSPKVCKDNCSVKDE